jgi:allene oxide cyclase
MAMKLGNHFKSLGIFLTGFLVAAIFFSNIGSLAQSGINELTVVERAVTDVVTDVGEEGDSVGDILTFANEIYDEANENLIGTDQGYCFRVIVGEAWECNWTILLADGSITVEGPFYDTAESILSITGGTGNYATITGQMILRAHDDTGTSFDFVYQYLLHDE